MILLDVDVLTELTGQYDPTAPGSVVPIGNNGAIGVPVQSIVLKTEIEDIGTLRQDDLIAWSIQRTLTDGTAWSLTLPADKPDNTIRGYETADYIPPTNPAAGKLLHELDWLAPPPALKNVDFVPAYLLDDNNEVDIRLLTDGISSDSNRSIDPTGHIMTINGLGPEGRYDRAIVCYLLPAGHGLTHGEIIEDLALLAGVPASKIAIGAQDGEPLIKPIEIINEIWWDVAIEIADGANLIPYFDEFGVLRLRGYPPYEGASTQFNFTRANVSAGAKLEVQLNADVPTCVRVTATQLVPPEDPCDVVTKVTLTETLQPFSIPVATHRQGPSGNITATGAIPSPTVLQVVRRETVIQEIWGSCQKVQEVIT
ncbi:MAG: hypothetical protein HKO76_03925, partial [Acidimicrobiia bacterium]|nr:hypothetical protein [Acidimicrobiia bacterium]